MAIITLKTRNAGNVRNQRQLPLSFRLAAYRGLRRFAGPVLAHRLAFWGGAK